MRRGLDTLSSTISSGVDDWLALIGRFGRRRAALLTYLAVAVLSVCHFPDLGYSSLHPWDECLYAIRARVATLSKKE